jgi:hypothetical protein
MNADKTYVELGQGATIMCASGVWKYFDSNFADWRTLCDISKSDACVTTAMPLVCVDAGGVGYDLIKVVQSYSDPSCPLSGESALEGLTTAEPTVIRTLNLCNQVDSREHGAWIEVPPEWFLQRPGSRVRVDVRLAAQSLGWDHSFPVSRRTRASVILAAAVNRYGGKRPNDVQVYVSRVLDIPMIAESLGPPSDTDRLPSRLSIELEHLVDVWDHSMGVRTPAQILVSIGGLSGLVLFCLCFIKGLGAMALRLCPRAPQPEPALRYITPPPPPPSSPPLPQPQLQADAAAMYDSFAAASQVVRPHRKEEKRGSKVNSALVGADIGRADGRAVVLTEVRTDDEHAASMLRNEEELSDLEDLRKVGPGLCWPRQHAACSV